MLSSPDDTRWEFGQPVVFLVVSKMAEVSLIAGDKENVVLLHVLVVLVLDGCVCLYISLCNPSADVAIVTYWVRLPAGRPFPRVFNLAPAGLK